MNQDYMRSITERIQTDVNNWIEQLKIKHPELLLTRQWHIVWPKGFREGQNSLPVVTSTKSGQYLIGEVQMVLSSTLDLDLDAIQLVQKDEPYVPVVDSTEPQGLDGHLSLINDVVVGLNGFLGGMQIKSVHDRPDAGLLSGTLLQRPIKPLEIHRLNGTDQAISSRDLTTIKSQMLSSPDLPEWYDAIESDTVSTQLLDRMAQGYLQQSLQTSRRISLKEYFQEYTRTLLSKNKLHHFCPYKGKPVTLDIRDECTETYCSKKPFNAKCPQSTLRFGAIDK